MQVTRRYVQNLLDEMFDFGLDEAEIRFEYSGRAMYSKTCVAFVTPEALKLVMTMAAVLAINEKDADDSGATYEGLCWYDLNPRMDNMGLDTVVYFTNVQVEN